MCALMYAQLKLNDHGAGYVWRRCRRDEAEEHPRGPHRDDGDDNTKQARHRNRGHKQTSQQKNTIYKTRSEK